MEDTSNILDRVHCCFIKTLPKNRGKKFIDGWMQMLCGFVKSKKFKCFYPSIPVPSQIIKNPSALLVVSTYVEKKYNFLKRYPVTIFPLVPFKIYLTDTCICCSVDTIIELLVLYIKATRVSIIGFHNIGVHEKKIRGILSEQIEQKSYYLYTSRLYKYFCAKVRKRWKI